MASLTKQIGMAVTASVRATTRTKTFLRSSLAAAALLALVGPVLGGTVVEADLKSTAYTAGISYTGGSAEVYAGAFDVHALGSSYHFTAYCVDLTHDMSVSGNVFTVNPGNFASAFSPQVADEVGFLVQLDTTKGIGGATIPQALGEAAVQLAIWADIDPGFQATSFSSSDLAALYAYDRDLSRNLGGRHYDVGYLGAVHVGNLYQNLAYAVPEPSSLALGVVGALGSLGCAWRRRRAASA